jgi:hypothetical protein
MSCDHTFSSPAISRGTDAAGLMHQLHQLIKRARTVPALLLGGHAGHTEGDQWSTAVCETIQRHGALRVGNGAARTGRGTGAQSAAMAEPSLPSPGGTRPRRARM